MKSMAYQMLISTAFGIAVTNCALADDNEITLYGGYQSLPSSTLTYDDGTTKSSHSIDWEGKPLAMPPYYGMRYLRWSGNSAFGIELSHDKAYAPASQMNDAGFDRLEFTDGQNIVTLNYHHAFPDLSFQPYLGVGVGLAIPHVDVQPTGSERTYGYQVTGPAMRLTAGGRYSLNETIDFVAEYQFTYSQNLAELESGGTVDTDLTTNAVNLGLSFSF